MKKYDETKFYRIIDNTQSNYANQLKRLSKNDKRASFILIYYSISLVVYSLTLKYFPNLLDTDAASFFGIILSIIVLIYSLVNSHSRYSERISTVQMGLNKMKSLKRQLGINGNLDEVRKEYEKIVNSIEIREDVDFYHTVCHLCKQYGINRFTGKDEMDALPPPPNSEGDVDTVKNEIRGYISEIKPLSQEIYIQSLRLWHMFLYLLPILIFLFCMYTGGASSTTGDTWTVLLSSP